MKYYRLIKKLNGYWFPRRHIPVGTVLKVTLVQGNVGLTEYNVYLLDSVGSWIGLIDDVDLREHFIELDEGMCKALYAT